MKRINLVEYRDKINAISPSFCVAKWKQVTLHLHNGHTHSCHHPKTHLVPLEELSVNPSALHNTNFKKQQRKLMLEGARPSECDYCWRVEDSDPNAISDRIHKSTDKWARDSIAQIIEDPWDKDTNPTYLEVSFSNVCNFKCSYCSPNISSQWMEEIERYGPYPTSSKYNNLEWFESQGQIPIPHKDYNPYVEAFWKWFPDIYNSLIHFRITGGEPLLSKDTFKILDYINDNPSTELNFSVNSNLCPPDAVFDNFISRVKTIKVKQFKIFTSCEAHGAQAEYIRFGLDYNKWLANVIRVLNEVDNSQVSITSTYNFLSIFNYDKFLKDIKQLKQQYPGRVSLDIPYLRHPEHQTIFIAPTIVEQYMSKQLDTIRDGFEPVEIGKFERVYNLIKDSKQDDPKNQRDFILFVNEHDRRRGTDFLAIFPEMEKYFYKWCQLS
jgi:sulfatase maturation enzyme AslB (radical SAM superfamily)